MANDDVGETESARRDSIWCVYNHMPYGNVCLTHFETTKRRKKSGTDSSVEIVTTAQEKLAAFTAAKHIGLYTIGKDGAGAFERGKVFLPKIEGSEKDPAARAFEQAEAAGVRKVPDPKDKAKAAERDERVSRLEDRVGGIETNVSKILEILSKKG